MSQNKIPPKLRALLKSAPIVLADVGAAGGIHERWNDLGMALRVMGFEPDQRAFQDLPKNDRMLWTNAALADYEGEAKLLVTRHQTNTSLLEPNREVIDHIYGNPADFDVVKEVKVPCTTLDGASAKAGVFPTAIKIDTQGTELSILMGAIYCLNNSLMVIEAEVEFIHLYKNQPLFADVDNFLISNGFLLFDLGNLLMLKRGRYGFHRERKGQLIAADALYFRSPKNLLELVRKGDIKNSSHLIIQYCGVCAVYGYRNLALEALNLLKEHDAIEAELFDQLIDAIEFDGEYSLKKFWPGQGRISKWLRKCVEMLEPRHNSIWINELGND